MTEVPLVEIPVLTFPDGNREGAGDSSGSPNDIELRMLELRHRIKNVLSVVQSLVNQTLRCDVTLPEAREALASRLAAISHAVDLLLSNAWQPMDLTDLLRSAISLGAERLHVQGPDVRVGPSSTMMLSILFHELECNAIKYGALSCDGGNVHVSWSIEGEMLSVRWREQGGPRVEAPAGPGFGSTLVSRIADRIHGTAAPEFRPEGLCWTLCAPVESLGS